ncbi:hypothetical protein [Paracnuella aquatica]|uniref:hypothetical protein n=1 Tax=Paracnuella aquatica TaxID=2268757 RepID=UPI000DEF6522|nr:hypothetical protein [Paracnuella aquatica]RPD43408.1 hypothetical protein DRJ53_20315 [Paracnuella aquatica]
MQHAHWFAKIWAFEKVLNLLPLFSNRTKAKLKLFKSPYFGKPFHVSSQLLMTHTEQRWHVDLVRDRYQYLNLSYEQAEKVHMFEQDKDIYSDKHYFTAWEEWDFEATAFQDILNEEQFATYNAVLNETIQRYEKGLIEQDNQDLRESAFYEDLYNYYQQHFVPDFFMGPFLGLIWLPVDTTKIDFLRAEYKYFLNDSKKELLTSHFRHNRRFKPNQLKGSLLRHKVACIFPDYHSFKHRMDEPTKATSQYLKAKILQLPEETENLVNRKFNELREFMEANFTKHYGDIRGWHIAVGHFSQEEEREHRVMSLLLLDRKGYGC